MGATNSTLHYNLSQFISTDKPAWLQDYNGDMQKIDTGINGALTAAESAQNSADSASSGVSSLSDSVSALSTTVSGHTSDITDLSGDVNTIESLIGNGTPTAGDHTLIGAINTNTSDIASLGAGLKFYTKTTASLASGASESFNLPSGFDVDKVMVTAYYRIAEGWYRYAPASEEYAVDLNGSVTPATVTVRNDHAGARTIKVNLMQIS